MMVSALRSLSLFAAVGVLLCAVHVAGDSCGGFCPACKELPADFARRYEVLHTVPNSGGTIRTVRDTLTKKLYWRIEKRCSESVLREVRTLLHTFKHPFLVSMQFCFADESHGRVYLFTDPFYSDAATIYSKRTMRSCKDCDAEKFEGILRHLIGRTALGLAHVHGKHIIHGDVQLRNIAMHNYGLTPWPKLGGFSKAWQLIPHKTHIRNNTGWTYGYEDDWAGLGRCIDELRHLHASWNDSKVPWPKSIDSLRASLHANADDRIRSLAELKRHPFFQGFIWSLSPEVVCPIANRPIPPGMFRVIYDRILDYDAIQRELIYLWRISLLPYPPASLALPNDVLDDEHEVGFEYPGSRDSQKTLRQILGRDRAADPLSMRGIGLKTRNRVLRGLLTAVAALHTLCLAHGDISLDTVVVAAQADIRLQGFGKYEDVVKKAFHRDWKAVAEILVLLTIHVPDGVEPTDREVLSRLQVYDSDYVDIIDKLLSPDDAVRETLVHHRYLNARGA
ncbi:unnamed protein product (mitochondrion) [Plasmodiophora brassicae]|uniref:non-specific serine/threonine protein kinase n=1 Tax=Plasmodiophora brassicae TaxID=37360 RepID=A0A3P3YGM9_PLABS|nr:unnamed protein product [Plasmodiophora brassicae]